MSKVIDQEVIKNYRNALRQKYNGFWQCMDYRRERDLLEKLIQDNKAVWMKWEKKYEDS